MKMTDPEKNFSFKQPLQDEALSKKMISKEKESEVETEDYEVIDVIEKCCEFDNQINLISEAYHLACGGPMNLLDEFSNLIEIETPMKNSVLHIAAWNGNDDIVSLLIERAPKLLFKFNKNRDSVLHVAARNGHISTIKKLLKAYGDKSNTKDLLNFVKLENDQGNTMFHEAMLCHKRNIDRITIFNVCEQYKTEDLSEKSLSNTCYDYAVDIVNHEKKTVLYLAVENGNKDEVHVILENCRKTHDMPVGLSPLIAALLMHNQEMLRIIIRHRPTWIHTRDKHKMLPLHYAASIGFLEGVDLLLGLCQCCTIQRDEDGYFPIHLASYGGHVEVVKKLLEYCPDPTEMLDTSHERNIVHIAAMHGKYEVVCYILQSELPEHQKLINQKDKEGDTPLHLAARSCYPTTVYYLVNHNKKKVNLDLVNNNNETALDIIDSFYEARKSSFRQHLTSTALESAGAKKGLRKVRLHIEPNTSETSHLDHAEAIENPIIVSTLIVTASVAACLVVPGQADGEAYNLKLAMFHFFIIFITISLFSSISATIILFWGTVGLIELLIPTLKIVMPLLGIALISLSLAFMAGIYTVIGNLSWLANVFLVMTVIFIIIVVFLYILLFLPSSLTLKPLRYLSHYPFLFLASRSESDINQGIMPSG
ncbi:unnamed protein product [Lathyrus sativus]|nr:unnamed protein product [Lathyrus sativus]